MDGGEKWVVRSPVNEDVGVFTNDILDYGKGRVTIGLRTTVPPEFKVRKGALANSKRNPISNARNTSVDWALNDGGEHKRCGRATRS